MVKPLAIGITGGIGSGKTTVCRILHELGVPVYHADERAKWLMKHNPALKQTLYTTFGKKTFDMNGELNTNYLRSFFTNTAKLKQLNHIVHPHVIEDYKTWQQSKSTHPYTVKEAALLVESKTKNLLDIIIAVCAPKPLRIERIIKRDSHRSQHEIIDIMEQQIDDENFKKHAQHIIVNDNVKLVIPQVLRLHHLFVERHYYALTKKNI